MDIITPVQSELLRAAAGMVAKKEFSHLLYIGDLPLPDDLVRGKSTARRKLIQAVTSEAQRQVIEAMGIATISLPTYDIARPERFKIALVGGIAKGIFKQGEVVLGMIGRGPTGYPDTIYVAQIGDNEDTGDTGFGVVGTEHVPSPILQSVIDLAVEIARDGWEGRPLGTLLMIGDTSAVMEKSRQLTLNPFQGYSESEKNILNPGVRDAIKNFAVLDGAFVIREDGVVLSAGRYLKFDDEAEFEIPLGLGSRHMAAAGTSKVTDAIAIVVSETTGITRVFQAGNCVLEIHSEQRGRRTPDEEAMVEAAAKAANVDQTRNAAVREALKEVREAAKQARDAAKEVKDATKDAKSAKDAKDAKDAKSAKSAKDAKDAAKDAKETKSAKGAKDTKDLKAVRAKK